MLLEKFPLLPHLFSIAVITAASGNYHHCPTCGLLQAPEKSQPVQILPPQWLYVFPGSSQMMFPKSVTPIFFQVPLSCHRLPTKSLHQDVPPMGLLESSGSKPLSSPLSPSPPAQFSCPYLWYHQFFNVVQFSPKVYKYFFGTDVLGAILSIYRGQRQAAPKCATLSYRLF